MSWTEFSEDQVESWNLSFSIAAFWNHIPAMMESYSPNYFCNRLLIRSHKLQANMSNDFHALFCSTKNLKQKKKVLSFTHKFYLQIPFDGKIHAEKAFGI